MADEVPSDRLSSPPVRAVTGNGLISAGLLILLPFTLVGLCTATFGGSWAGPAGGLVVFGVVLILVGLTLCQPIARVIALVGGGLLLLPFGAILGGLAALMFGINSPTSGAVDHIVSAITIGAAPVVIGIALLIRGRNLRDQ